jgi:hypothetical protein
VNRSTTGATEKVGVPTAGDTASGRVRPARVRGTTAEAIEAQLARVRLIKRCCRVASLAPRMGPDRPSLKYRGEVDAPCSATGAAKTR